MTLKIAITIALAVILQTSLRVLWPDYFFVDLPLIVVVYFALRRDPVQSVVIGAVTGLVTDALSRGLLGANGFSKTLIAYSIAALGARIVLLDNSFMRIPVLAAAAALDAVVFVFLHRILGQPSLARFAETTAYLLIGTLIAGTLIFYVLDNFFSERVVQRRQFAFRRRIARRGIGRRR